MFILLLVTRQHCLREKFNPRTTTLSIIKRYHIKLLNEGRTKEHRRSRKLDASRSRKLVKSVKVKVSALQKKNV